MTRLVEALRALGLEGEVDLSGRWVKLRGEQCAVYVVEVASSARYYTWCECPEERSVESYFDPTEAIHAGLRRAASPYRCEAPIKPARVAEPYRGEDAEPR